jgi:hypothetical protein
MMIIHVWKHRSFLRDGEHKIEPSWGQDSDPNPFLPYLSVDQKSLSPHWSHAVKTNKLSATSVLIFLKQLQVQGCSFCSP